VLTAAQIRGARGLLDWSQQKLAAMTKLSVQTIKRMEGARGPEGSTEANVEAVRRALESAGVIFLQAKENRDGGPGVRLKK
jgi:ribosome-binding protein aMBF1 (putative translation factor)